MIKNIYIQTFGCQMNVYDSERLKSILISKGYSLTEKPSEADVIVLNTCCVREHAENRAMGRLAELNKFKQQNPDVILAMVGCSAQKSGEKLLKKAPFLDLVLGTSQIFNLPDYLSQDVFAENKKSFPLVSLDDSDLFFSNILPIRKNQFTSYVAISRGCDNYCSYCIVPYVRGPEKHRKWGQILEEVQCLAESAYLEVSLIGQNVNSYKDGECDFPDLLQKVNDQTDIKRIRFMTSHPKDLSEKLMDKIAFLPKVCEHLHLPLQSGSNEILKQMNRGYTSENYLTLIENAKRKIENLSITTDLIVGFPGETEKDFEGTLNLVKMVEFDSSFMFRYSSREGTQAAKFEDDVSEEEKLKRLNILIQLQKEISLRKNKKLIGKLEEVLIDGKSKRDEKSWKGKSRGNKTVIVKDEKDLLGSIVPVKIIDSGTFTLFGELVH
jgi:tRNA-2-methylthio-N6-dimethylallyladenosine synthase